MTDRTPERLTEPDPLVGTVLQDRYRVERVVGVGGVGSVYRGMQLGLDRRVAIKVLRPELIDSRTALERFAREARTAARLQHPNVVTVHDFGTTPDGRAFLVMEYLEGLNLAQWIRKRKPTDLARAAEYLVSAAGAIGALHELGIIHRDIKPSNIMLIDRPAGRSVKVVDFGLVRPTISDDSNDLTGGLVLGTPEFMAPELFTGRKPDERSDLYALGITAYETITGELPFGTGNFRELFLRQTNDVARRPSSLRADVPIAVDAVIAKALAKAPERRYALTVDFADALRDAFRAEPRRRRAASILLVEDDELVRGILLAVLESRGYDVTVAADGIDAFLTLGRGGVDVVVSDVQMPNLDGFALLRLMHQKGIATPVVFLAGTASERDRELASELGAFAFLTKTGDSDVLVAAIERAIDAAAAAGAAGRESSF